MTLPTKIEKLEELIKGKIAGEILEQTVEPLVAPGENFGSVIYKVDFKVKNGKKEETYHAVAKCTPPNKVTQEMINIKVAMKVEIAWYTTVIPTIQDFQRDNGIEQVADFFQKFYGARISLDSNSDIVDIDAVILTENLKPLGYVNIDRHIGFDLKISKAILKDLATFHSVPIAIKIRNKELFDKNIKPFLPGLTLPEDPSNKDQDFFKDFKQMFAEMPEIAPHMDKIVSHLDNVKPYSNELPTKEPWGSISHNDFWINNIMIKDGDNNKTVFLDFQIPAYHSIAIDLVFFLIVSVSLEVISKHMDELIKYYWDQFIMNLKQLKIDTPLFTFKQFLNEIDDAASSGLFGRALFHTYIIQQDKGTTIFDSSNENFDKKDLENSPPLINERHKEKYKWLASEFIRRGFIKSLK